MPGTFSRRDVLNLLGSGILLPNVARALARGEREASLTELSKRPLGATGFASTLLGFGGYQLGFGSVSRRDAEALLHSAIDNGINYFDTASSYGNSEEKFGAVIPKRRQQVFLATKVLRRTRKEADEEIRESLRRLRVETIDLLQIHAVNDEATLQQVLSNNGCLAAAQEFQESGAVRFLGITGHRRPEIIARALALFPFATVLVPLSAADRHLYDFEQGLLPIAAKANVGVIGMKALAGGRMTADVSGSLRYAMVLPVATVIVGMSSLRELEHNLTIARSFVPLSPTEREKILARGRNYATVGTLWWKQ